MSAASNNTLLPPRSSPQARALSVIIPGSDLLDRPRKEEPPYELKDGASGLGGPRLCSRPDPNLHGSKSKWDAGSKSHSNQLLSAMRVCATRSKPMKPRSKSTWQES